MACSFGLRFVFGGANPAHSQSVLRRKGQINCGIASKANMLAIHPTVTPYNSFADAIIDIVIYAFSEAERP
jgi:hypothetical protein